MIMHRIQKENFHGINQAAQKRVSEAAGASALEAAAAVARQRVLLQG